MFWTKFLLLISTLCFSCHVATAQVNQESDVLASYRAPLDKDYDQLLYKMKLYFGSHFFSGLVVIKKDASKDIHHIVCLTEVGLNIMEFQFEKGKIELVKKTALFKSNRLSRLMKKYFILLLQDVEQNKIDGVSTDEGIRIKTKLPKGSGVSGRNYYLYDHQDELKKIYSRGFFPLKYTLTFDEDKVPSEILFSKRIWFYKLRIALQLLKKS